MKIAVTYEDGNVYQHFGHTEHFKIYDVENGRIKNSEVIGTDGNGHEALAGYLQGGQVQALICGGIGYGAQVALEQSGIRLYAGVTGSADDAVQALLDGKLDYTTEANCNHHDEEGHSCH